MTKTDTPQMKLLAKYKAMQKLKVKRDNVKRQIDILNHSLSSAEIDIQQSESEYERMQELLGELETLEKKKTANVAEMQRLMEHYNQFPWTPDMPEEHKISNSNFDEISAETSEINARILEIPKEINKVYYRR
jgi:multidrug resistance efflux pump